MEALPATVDPFDAAGLLDGVAQALGTWDLDSLSAAELHEQAVALTLGVERVQAGIARLLQRWDALGVWTDDGSKAASARLSRETGLSKRAAAGRLSTARSVAQMPVAGPRWLAGELTEDSIKLLTHARGGKRAALFARDEEILVDFCVRLRHQEAARAIHYWIQRADAELNHDGDEPHERFCKLNHTLDGAVSINAVLDPIGGAEVQEALRRIERELYRQDKADGTKRSTAERNADALIEMARRAMATPEGARRPQPLVMIVAGETSMAQVLELSNGAVVRPADVAARLDESMVQSFIYDGAVPLAATTQRTFTGRLRRAIQARDRRCQHPSGCDEPISRCDVDHIHPVADGQPTAPWNGQLLCEVHNRNGRLRNRSPNAPPLDNVRFIHVYNVTMEQLKERLSG